MDKNAYPHVKWMNEPKGRRRNTSLSMLEWEETMNHKTGVRKRIISTYILVMTVAVSIGLSMVSSLSTVRAADNGGFTADSQGDAYGDQDRALAEQLSKNIVRVIARLKYEDSVLKERSSTGFFISTSRQDAYIATTCDVLFSDKEIDTHRETIKSNLEENYNRQINIDEQFFVSFGGDIQTSAERTNIISEKRNILVLRANNIAGSETSLKVQFDEELLESVHLVGFKADSNETGKYDVDNMSYFPGTVIESSGQRADECIKLKVIGENLEDENLLGSPIVNDDGCVIGIFSGMETGQYALAVPIRYLKELLEFQGIAVSEKISDIGNKRPVYVYVLVIVAAFLAVFTLAMLLLDTKNSLFIRRRWGFGGRNKEKHIPKLSRKKTEELISIDTDEFLIGADQKQCSYVINDNKSFESVQFGIIHERRKYYFVNLAFVSSTLLNDKETEPNLKIRLKNRAAIQVGTERFVFLMD